MSKITVSSFATAAGSHWSGNVAYLRVYYYGSRPEAFSFSTGEVWSPSLENFYSETACTLAANVVTVPTTVQDSTPDITNRPDVFARWVLVDSSRSEDSQILLATRWDIPVALGSTVTFEQLRVHNETPVTRFEDSRSLSRTAIEELIAGARAIDSVLVGLDSADYASLSAAVTSIGSVPSTLLVTNPLPSGASTTVPSTLRLRFVPGGSIVLGSGHTVAIASDASDFPIAQIFSGSGTVTLAGASTLYPEWWGALGDNSTDDSVAFNKCFTAALNGNSDKTVRLGAKVYVIGSALTAGSSTRTIGLTIAGSGKYASRLRWTGNTSDTVLKIWNIQYPNLRDFGIEGTTVPGTLLWYAVDNGKAGSGPVTEKVYLSNGSIGMLIGGGAELSSGQVNSGRHENLSIDSAVTGVKITGANTEVQTFDNLTMGGGAMTRGFHLLNGRGLYVKNADISLNTAGSHIPFFVDIDDGAGYAHGGGFTFEDMRMEGMAGFLWAHIDNPALPLNLTLKNVSCASEPVGTSAPHDILKLDTGNWTVKVENSIFLAAQSRFSFLNLNQIRFVDFFLEGCQINNGFGATTPDDDPSVLLNVTRDAALSPAATGGIRAYLKGNLLTATSGVFQPVRQLKDRLVYATDLDISTATLQYLDIQDTKGKTLTQLIAGGAATTIAAGAGAGTSPTIAIAGKSLSGKVTLTTGTTPSASATVFTVTFPAAFASAPQVILTPVGPNAAALSGNAQVYVDSASTSTTAFVVKVGSTNLVAATQYIWSYQVIQ